MTDDAPGRFKKGAPSPNPRGRPARKIKRIETIDDLNMLIVENMNRPIIRRTKGGQVLPPVTTVEHNIDLLGSGDPPNRLAAQTYVELCKSALIALESSRRRREEEERRIEHRKRTGEAR